MKSYSDIFASGHNSDRSAFVDTTGGGGSFTTVSVDFGTTPVYSKAFTVTVTGATTLNKIVATEETSLTLDEVEMDALILAGHVSATDTVTIYATATPGPITGTRYVNISLG